MNKEEQRTNEVTAAIVNDQRLSFVRPGWHKLLMPLLLKADEEGATIQQIKEKFGGLRFYVWGASDELRNMIQKAETDSFKICQECGEPGEPRGPGWIRTLCDKHVNERPSLPGRTR